MKIIILSILLSTALLSVFNNSYAAPKAEVWGECLKGNYVGKSVIESKITGVTYPYHVYLPASYEKNKDKVYPIIYTLDGQWNFKGFAYSIDSHDREVIVIGIEEGPTGSDRRSIDYRLPGAVLYIDFFRKEFLPLIEAQYRVDASNRSFQGTSFGGIIATAFLFLDDPKKALFKNYIVYDASYWDKPELLTAIIDNRLKKEEPINANLYFTTAIIGNHFTVKSFMESIDDYAIPGLNTFYDWYFVTHNSVTGASMEDTFDLIYGKKN